MIHVSGLRVVYGELVAVGGLDLHAAAGSILALLGPNGAGKSSTIRCLVGLQRPSAGTLRVAGHDVLAAPAEARRAVSYLAEVTRVHDALSPLEYLELKGRLFDLDEATIALRARRLLEGFGLAERLHQPMAGFSKGMVQKASLAAALLVEPKVLVLDEPLTGLDVDATLVVKEVLRGFAARGGTVLYSSHLLDVVETLADVVAVIDRGQLLACGTLAELRDRAGTGAARLDEVFRVLTHAADPALRARAILDASRETPQGQARNGR
ncbi:MAG: ABC transporter ATP-binding protein [Planctomycetes bacterium]|nr:ABC transporter ATP-binding protein [Planctomycetota bacterium]